MRPILMLSGPNLNLLGRRDSRIYGDVTLTQLEKQVTAWGIELGFEVRSFQSNHEGALIDALQKARSSAHGVLLNPGALAHYSYALHDAIVDFGRPVIEVHLSRVSRREAWRRKSVTRPACAGFVEGLGAEGYRVALRRLAELDPGPPRTSPRPARTKAPAESPPKRRERSGRARRPPRGTSGS